jgi:hypothetical protein
MQLAQCRTVVYYSTLLGESESPGSIYGDHKVPVEETIAIQHLLPDQGSDHVSDDFLYLVGICPTKCLIEGVPVGASLYVKQGLKLGRRASITTKQVSNLSPCPQAA